jgi:hypothetical protein
VVHLIPEKAVLMTGAPLTLKQIGYEELLKPGNRRWHSLKWVFVAEKDTVRQSQLRKLAKLADYFLGGVHAIAGTVEILAAFGFSVPMKNRPFRSMSRGISRARSVPSAGTPSTHGISKGNLLLTSSPFHLDSSLRQPGNPVLAIPAIEVIIESSLYSRRSPLPVRTGRARDNIRQKRIEQCNIENL